MASIFRTTALLYVCTALLRVCSGFSCTVNGHNYEVASVISRNITIIGGGSSGTYSAVRMQDFNQSVLVIERKARLGGHTETYIDPQGAPLDIGVQYFHNTDVVKNYLLRFNTPLILVNATGAPGPKNKLFVISFL